MGSVLVLALLAGACSTSYTQNPAKLAVLDSVYCSSSGIGRARALQQLEDLIIADVRRHGQGSRLAIAGIQPDAAPPVAFTMKVVGRNQFHLSFDALNDVVEVRNMESGIFGLGDRSVVRFVGNVPFPVETPVSSAESQSPFQINGFIGLGGDAPGESKGTLVTAQPSGGTWVFDGDRNDPLAFALLDHIGFIYLHGKGTVVMRNGDTLQFPPRTP